MFLHLKSSHKISQNVWLQLIFYWDLETEKLSQLLKTYRWERDKLFGVHMMEPCLFYAWDAAVLWLLLRTTWDRTKQASFVATAFAWYCFCWLLPVEPSEGHKLLEKSYYTGEAVVFHWTGCDSNMTCLEFFSMS